MNTMPLNELFPITKRDISFLDFQYAGGKVGLTTVINVPYDALDEILNPESTLDVHDKAQRHGLLCVQLHTLALTPSYYTEAFDEYDFDNPYSSDNFDHYSNRKVLDDLARSLQGAYLSAKEERDAGKPASIIVLASNTQLPGREDQSGALNLNLFVTEETYEPNNAFHLRAFANSTARLEESGLTNGEEMSLTNMRTFSEPANTMDMSPLHSTDFREYEKVVDPTGSELDPDMLKDRAQMMETLGSLSDDTDPLEVMDSVLGKGSDEHRAFVFSTIEGVVRSLVKGDTAPPGVVIGITERFIENEWDDLPPQIKNALPTFIQGMLELPETYTNVYQLDLKGDERTIFLFSPHDNSLAISLHHAEEDTLTFEAGTYVAFGENQPNGFTMVDLGDASKMPKENIVIPLSHLEGIRNVTEHFTETVRHSFVLSLVAAKLESEGNL